MELGTEETLEKAFLWHVAPWHLEILWQSGKRTCGNVCRAGIAKYVV